MAKINQINLDGTLYEIGGEDYTAGTNISISNGVISAPNVYSKVEIDAMFAQIIDGDNISYGGNS